MAGLRAPLQLQIGDRRAAGLGQGAVTEPAEVIDARGRVWWEYQAEVNTRDAGPSAARPRQADARAEARAAPAPGAE